MHTSLLQRAWVCPQQFLSPIIRKLAKNLVYFGLYRRGLLGELHQTFLLDVSRRSIKILASNLGSFPPKILEPKNVVFNYATPHRLHCRQQTVRCLLRYCDYWSFRDVCRIFPFPRDALLKNWKSVILLNKSKTHWTCSNCLDVALSFIALLFSSLLSFTLFIPFPLSPPYSPCLPLPFLSQWWIHACPKLVTVLESCEMRLSWFSTSMLAMTNFVACSPSGKIIFSTLTLFCRNFSAFRLRAWKPQKLYTVSGKKRQRFFSA